MRILSIGIVRASDDSCNNAAGARGATVVVPPTSTANVSRYGPRSSARDRTILAVKERGRRRWTKTSGYHGQARVENAFFRYKSIIGDSLRACSPAGRGTEVVLACNILNQMTGLGRPCRTASVGEGTVDRARCGLAPIYATTPRLATSGTGRWSASRRIVTICSSVNRVFLMAPPMPGGRHALKRQLVRKTAGMSRRQAPTGNVASILDSARELGIRDA